MRRVAITAFGVVSPVGAGREEFWSALARGESGIGKISVFDASTLEARLAAEAPFPSDLPEEVAICAREDRKIGFAHAACAEAMRMAGQERFPRNSLLHLGTSLETFDLSKIIHNGRTDFREVVRRALNKESRPLQTPLDTATKLLTSVYGKPTLALTNCSACAAGAQAIGHGFRAIRSGRFDFALCGGFDSMITPLGVGGFQLLGALSTDLERGAYACRPFDSERGGAVLGEGAAVLALEPLEKARAEGKSILAEICGYGSTFDAHGLSAPAPDGDGAERAMRMAIDDARLKPEAIDHVNAHGTGTRLNDRIEAEAIRRVFSGVWERIPVSAVKSMIGHPIAAAGAIEAGACLLALHRSVVPPNVSLRKPGEGCELLHVTEPHTRFDGEYALSNSFGFGGQNASLVFRRQDQATGENNGNR